MTPITSAVVDVMGQEQMLAERHPPSCFVSCGVVSAGKFTSHIVPSVDVEWPKKNQQPIMSSAVDFIYPSFVCHPL